MGRPALKERKAFIAKYEEFNQWLRDHDFRLATAAESSTPSDVSYEYYNSYLPSKSMYGVECYVLDALNFKLRFLRANDHHALFILNNGFLTGLDVAKIAITNLVLERKVQIQEKINNLRF